MSDALVPFGLSPPFHNTAPPPPISSCDFSPSKATSCSSLLSHRIMVLYSSWLSRSGKPKLTGHLRAIPRAFTASVLPCSLNRSSHSENPDIKQYRPDTSSWWGSGKSTLQKSMYDGKWCDHLWKYNLPLPTLYLVLKKKCFPFSKIYPPSIQSPFPVLVPNPIPLHDPIPQLD